MARARLRDRHQDNLRRKLEVLKAEQGVEEGEEEADESNQEEEEKKEVATTSTAEEPVTKPEEKEESEHSEWVLETIYWIWAATVALLWDFRFVQS